jgi:Icc-related predicted phosphoesterase
MKILFATDLHGFTSKYEALLEVAKLTEADVVINGGDMLPTTGDLFSQGDYIRNELDAHFKEFDEAGIYYLCYLGNDDLRIFDEVFEKTCQKYSFVFNLAQHKIYVGDFEFVGMNWVVDYPFRLKDRCRMDTVDYVFQEQYGTALVSTKSGLEEIENWFSYARTLPTIEEELNRLANPKDMKKAVYVIHMPPYKLGLDKCGHGAEVGSKAVFDFLHRRQPRLSLHGHIHESPEYSGKWHAKIGNTICIQPGQLGLFTYVTIDLETMAFDRHVIAI